MRETKTRFKGKEEEVQNEIPTPKHPIYAPYVKALGEVEDYVIDENGQFTL